MGNLAQASYASPITEKYTLPSSAFGASTATQTHKGPPGRRGYVRDIRVLLTADAVGTSAVPEIDVGNASGDYSYARFRLGTAAGTGYAASSSPFNARALCTGGNGLVPTKEDFTGHVKLETAYIPADTAFVITAKQGSGGSPAGTGIVEVTIDWF